MELTLGVAASRVFVALCFAKYMYLRYRIFNKYERGLVQCKNIDLETMMKSLRLTWLQRIIRVNEADEEYFSYNFDPENQLYAF